MGPLRKEKAEKRQKMLHLYNVSLVSRVALYRHITWVVVQSRWVPSSGLLHRYSYHAQSPLPQDHTLRIFEPVKYTVKLQRESKMVPYETMRN
uniref:Uncharacterized protein n=1 Tax=Rhizophora mucronata TaxID=61149 RepID=A0A2P2N2P1_RHIMU